MSKPISFITPCIAALIACSDAAGPIRSSLPASDVALAGERSFQVGGVTLRMPVLLLLSSTSTTNVVLDSPYSAERPAQMSIETLLSSPAFTDAAATGVAYVRISMGSLQALQDYRTDEHASTASVCPRLQREWARNICRTGLVDGRHVFYPSHFVLIDETYLAAKRPDIAFYAGDGLSIGQAAHRSIPRAGSDAPLAHCQTHPSGEKNGLCTVVARVGDNLLAVWSTNRSHAEGGGALEEQASRIRRLVLNGMGSSAR